MLRLKRKSALVPCFAILLFAGNALAQSGASAPQAPGNAAPSSAAKQPQQHSAKRSKTRVPEQQVVPPPATPLTPEQMAPVAPTVTYQGGELTIQSNNATLGQVLRSVQAKTGASFDVPASANSDRVVAQLGPGQPRDVLATLLNGSKFNYIILGSPTQPGAVEKLILTPRQNGPIANTAQNRPAPQPEPEPQQEEDYTPPEPTPVEENSVNGNPPPGAYRPGFTPTQPNQNGENQPENNGQPQQGVKTPEQLLQELQRMQQQQQLYQQQLNPANQQPQPQPQ
jgi:hypothetical protein